MSVSNSTSTESNQAHAVPNEVFALTDEQIVGLGSDDRADRGNAEVEVLRDANDAPLRMTDATNREVGQQDAGATGASAFGSGRSKDRPLHEEENGTGAAAALGVPQWLAERMRDPWHGDEAKEFWEGKQRAEKEVAAYREVFATAEDARALKEIYPGGAGEAKSAAERARTLDEIDAAFYRGDGVARAQLARHMMQQDPAAFREMVEAGVRLLGGDTKTRPIRSDRGAPEVEVLRDANDASLRMTGLSGRTKESQDAGIAERPALGGGPYKGEGAQALHKDSSGQVGVMVAPEVESGYRAFEKAANAELEKSVGGAIARVMEQALPNLRMNGARGPEGAQGTAPLQERLAGAVREEVEAALKSDGQLGEQVAKILAGRRFDDGVRAQVVRLIDARAQQLVPGAVRRVVGSWTQATLGARGKEQSSAGAARDEAGEVQRRTPVAPGRKDDERQASGKNERASTARRIAETSRGRRVDYRKISDEEILGM